MTDADLYHVLDAAGLRPRRRGKFWACRCPAHDDRLPSMSAWVSCHGSPMARCFAGCHWTAILAALGLSPGQSRPDVPPQRATPRQQPAIEDFGPSVREEWAAMKRQNPADEPAAHETALGIPGNGLLILGAVWVASLAALAAPMYAGPGGEVIGVRLRGDDGRKWAVKGSRNALFCPLVIRGDGPLYIPEGFTDTAALVGLGLDAVGRPSATGGRDLVHALASDRPMVVVADSDAPGQEGAWILARELKSKGCDVRVLTPPAGIKDAREWVKRGATKGSIEWATKHRGME